MAVVVCWISSDDLVSTFLPTNSTFLFVCCATFIGRGRDDFPGVFVVIRGCVDNFRCGTDVAGTLRAKACFDCLVGTVDPFDDDARGSIVVVMCGMRVEVAGIDISTDVRGCPG